MLWLKALHIVSVISWMAGLLYLYRLYVYHAMETEEIVRARFAVMERRLLRAIATPACLATLLTGIGMLVLVPAYLTQPWMHAKLLLVVGLLASQLVAVAYRRRLAADPSRCSHRRLRVLNEVPTLLMIGIVLLVVLKPASVW